MAKNKAQMETNIMAVDFGFEAIACLMMRTPRLYDNRRLRRKDSLLFPPVLMVAYEAQRIYACTNMLAHEILWT